MVNTKRNASAGLALLLGAALATFASPVRAEFPQVKINYVDTSQAPKIRIWASVMTKGWKPQGDKDLTGVTLFRKPQGAAAVEVLGFEEGELVLPKGLSEEEKKQKEAELAAELALAAEVDQGAAIVVVVPGFQDPEYRNGTLGERSRSGAGLFFKKLGKNNQMNAIWYNDFVWSYVHTEGRTNGLTKLEPELEKCAKWEREILPERGLTPEELAEKLAAEGGGNGLRKNEARCGLTKDYGEFGKYIQKSAYDGFWPQLFGLSQRMCVKPEHEIKRTGLAADGGETGEKRLTAIDAALEMLVKGGQPGMPKILILTGDGRDGYINATSDCRSKYTADCQGREDIKSLKGRAQREALHACVSEQLEKDIRVEQGAFIEKLPKWLGLAKAANIRIYSVIHPTAPPHARERMEVLAWRTGGTARYATDPNEVIDHYDNLITELNNQVVLTFVDKEATPNAELSYEIEARGLFGEGGAAAEATSDAYTAAVPPAIERTLVNEVKSFGEKKLGKTGFMAALIGVGLLLLVIVFKLVKKLVGAGKDAGAKAAKGAQGAGKGKMDAAAKAKAKAIEKAKKAKEAQKKAMEKAKKG